MAAPDARGYMATWSSPALNDNLRREGIVNGMWAGIINTYFNISANPAPAPVGTTMLAAEVTSFNMEKRADLVLYDVVQAPGGGALRIRIVYEGKGGDSNETLTNALTQCEAFAAAQVRDQLANGDVCFFIAAKGTKAKMRVAKRLDRDINSKALKATVNPGGLVTMSNGGENNAEAGTEIDVSTASGRDIVHAAMARMVVQLGAKNYSW